MVQRGSLVDELARLKKELERAEGLRAESEVRLARAVLLLENCVAAISANDRDGLEKTGGSIREFLDRLREDAIS